MFAFTWLVVVFPVLCLLKGWVLTKLWGWFIVPTFGLPALGVVAATGIVFTIALLVKEDAPKTDGKDVGTRLGKATAESITHSLFFLGVGWVASFFM